MKFYSSIFFCSVIFSTSLNCLGQTHIRPSDKNVAYTGRVKVGQDSACLFWPGNAISINFLGTGLNVTAKSLKEKDYYYVIVDHRDSIPFKISPDSIKSVTGVASGLPYGKHTVQIYKLTNSTSETRFYGFDITGKGKILPPDKPKLRKIEFYGNSITAGHGVDAPPGVQNSGAPQYFNNYYTYAALTARHFDAQYSFVARSGIGVMVSWFPEIMPEIYDRLDPKDPLSKWAFSNYTPDIVVVNLFQNDYWIVNMPENDQFKARFGTIAPSPEFIIKSYQSFIAELRHRYPKAAIICALGSMNATESGSKWPGYITQAVQHLHDEKIYTLFFPFKNTPGHPNRKEQQTMANNLISFIDRTIKW